MRELTMNETKRIAGGFDSFQGLGTLWSGALGQIATGGGLGSIPKPLPAAIAVTTFNGAYLAGGAIYDKYLANNSTFINFSDSVFSGLGL